MFSANCMSVQTGTTPVPPSIIANLLLHLDNAGLALIIDDSGYNKAVVGYGGIAQEGTKVKFGTGAYYASSNYMSVGPYADLVLGSGDFDIELFIWNVNNSPVHGRCLIDTRWVGTGFHVTTENDRLHYTNGASVTTTGTGVLSYVSWDHVAITRSSGVVNVWLNGVLDISVVDSQTYTGNGLTISDSVIPDYGFNGWIDEVRVVVGNAVYTAPFVPPIAPFTSTLLFDPYFANVSLLLHGDGANAGTSITDSGSLNVTVTRHGSVMLDTSTRKFGSASILFTLTSSDYISIPTVYFGSNAYTIEGWLRVASFPGGYQTIAVDAGGSGIYINSSHQLTWYYAGDNANSAALTAGVWYHFAAVRIGSTITLYLNGVGHSYTFPSYLDLINIGGHGSEFFNGNIDEFRVTNGVARYLTDFTPPTDAFPDTGPPATDPYFANVLLLLHADGTNGSTSFIDNSPLVATVTPASPAQISTAQVKYGTGSAVFNGSTAYLNAPVSMNPSTGSWTIEGWLYTISGSPSFVSGAATGNADGTDLYFINLGGTWYLGDGVTNNVSFSTAVQYGVWQHIAIVKNSTTYTVYFDGVSQNSSVTPLKNVAITKFSIGAKPAQSTYLNGYIDDFRVTNSARYTTNFSPPAAFPNS